MLNYHGFYRTKRKMVDEIIQLENNQTQYLGNSKDLTFWQPSLDHL